MVAACGSNHAATKQNKQAAAGGEES